MDNTNIKDTRKRVCEDINDSNYTEFIKPNPTSRLFKDLTGKKFNEWTVLGFAGGDRKWVCRCSCGRYKIVAAYSLTSGSSTSCGHATNNSFVDLTGQHFGEWTILSYVGEHKWRCQCSCGRIKDVNSSTLRSGTSTSCGCGKSKIMYKRYGESNNSRMLDHRSDWQIKALMTRESFASFISEHDSKPTTVELAEELGVGRACILNAAKRFNLTDMLELSPMYSHEEVNLCNYIKSIYNGEIVRNITGIINSYELDIYLPEKRLAIEFNGNYWHSDRQKDKMYHQKKTIAGIKEGIRIIHIYEYEWINKRDKIKNFLADTINGSSIRIEARNTDVCKISGSEAIDFENENHLQGYADASINMALKYDGNIVGIMTFKTPRFDTACQYELVRFCYKEHTTVVGGAERMFKHFLDEYNPTSIISYCDIGKFSGSTYTKLNFRVTENCLTEPGYVWVSGKDGTYLSRYQTMKSKLIEKGFGSADQTEDEIMNGKGYLKVYNSGNMKFVWTKNN